jgi:PD-(D/E)XK nuclease superfamily
MLGKCVPSYSFLDAEANCPRKAYHKFIARDLPREEQSDAQKAGIAVHTAFERRINEGTPLPTSFKKYDAIGDMFDRYKKEFDGHGLVQAELKLAMTADHKPVDFWSKLAYLRGALDVAVIFPDYKSAYVWDWKTGKVREDPWELQIQGLLLKALHPKLEMITGSYVWLKDGKLGEPHDLSDTDRTAASVRAQLGEVQRRAEWPARPNPLCGWCPVPKSKCEHSHKEG